MHNKKWILHTYSEKLKLKLPNLAFIWRILEAKSEFDTKNPTRNYPTINFILDSQTLNNLLFTLHATYGSHTPSLNFHQIEEACDNIKILLI
jgi:hypothetical protein